MNSLSIKMLQVPWKMKGWNSNMLQIPLKIVEMAASSSKVLQIAWKMDRTGNQQRKP